MTLAEGTHLACYSNCWQAVQIFGLLCIVDNLSHGSARCMVIIFKVVTVDTVVMKKCFCNTGNVCKHYFLGLRIP